MKFKIKSVLLKSLLAASMLLSTGILSSCTIGLRKETKIVYASIGKLDPEMKGALRIATNDDIMVTIVGDPETVDYLNLGGYYAVSAADLKLFIKALKLMKESP